MRNFKLSLIALLGTLTVFFNIERLNFGEANIIDIQTFVYVVGAIAVAVIVYLQGRMTGAAWVTIWGVVYLICKLWFFRERPIVGGIHTYISITEVTLLTLVVLTAHWVSLGLDDFASAVRDLTLTEGGRRIPEMNDIEEAIEVEFTRSRRHHRPISVILIEPEQGALEASEHRLVQEIQEAMLDRYVLNTLGHRLSRNMRRTDLIFEHPSKRRLVVLSPETEYEDLKELIRRIQSIAHERFGMPVAFGFASFPEQAYTFEELLHKAELSLQQEQLEEEVTTTSIFHEVHE